jgi:hypothetical protein
MNPEPTITRKAGGLEFPALMGGGSQQHVRALKVAVVTRLRRIEKQPNLMQLSPNDPFWDRLPFNYLKQRSTLRKWLSQSSMRCKRIYLSISVKGVKGFRR